MAGLYFSDSSTNSKVFFLDASISTKRNTVEYGFRIRNILGEVSYCQTEFADYYSKKTVTDVRPREFTLRLIFTL